MILQTAKILIKLSYHSLAVVCTEKIQTPSIRSRVCLLHAALLLATSSGSRTGSCYLELFSVVMGVICNSHGCIYASIKLRYGVI